MAGIGAALIVTALLFLWLGSGDNSEANSAQRERSVVPAAVNMPAPELSLENIEGMTESLADYRENVVLVNNWATWCPPCKAEMPTLEAYYKEHSSDGLMIIAISAGDPRKDVLTFARDYGLTFRVWLDPNSESLRAFGNGNLPNSYVLDRSGTIRYAWTGQIDRTMLEKYVTPLLAGRN